MRVTVGQTVALLQHVSLQLVISPNTSYRYHYSCYHYHDYLCYDLYCCSVISCTNTNSGTIAVVSMLITTCCFLVIRMTTIAIGIAARSNGGISCAMTTSITTSIALDAFRTGTSTRTLPVLVLVLLHS